MNHSEIIEIINCSEPVFTWPVHVYYEDTDAAGVVYFANYLKFMERARTEWLRQFGCNHTELADKDKIAFVVRSLKVEYLKPARLNENLEVKTQIKTIRKVRLEFIQAIVCDDNLLAVAETMIACVDLNTFKPIPIPQSLISQIENK